MLLPSVICLAFFFNRKNIKEEAEEGLDDNQHQLLCRFVYDGIGRKIGETISFDDDIIIIKSGATYLGVPLKHIEETGKTLLVKGLVDLDKAKEMGEQWRQESFREINKAEEV